MKAPILDNDIEKLKVKVSVGAEYVYTQMFFANSKFIEIIAKCSKIGITIPIILGLKPIDRTKHLNNIPHRFHVDLPEELISSINECRSDLEIREVGIEWCTVKSKEIISSGVEILHYYSMFKSTNIHKIASSIF